MSTLTLRPSHIHLGRASMVASCAVHSSTSGSRSVRCSFWSCQSVWSGGSEAVEGEGTATLHRRVKGSRGRQGGALCQPWAALQRIQVDPDFNSPSLFVVYIGVRQAITAVERGATAIKCWSDGDAATLQRIVKGDPLSTTRSQFKATRRNSRVVPTTL